MRDCLFACTLCEMYFAGSPKDPVSTSCASGLSSTVIKGLHHLPCLIWVGG